MIKVVSSFYIVRSIFFISILGLFVSPSIQAQSFYTQKIMTYNLLDYSGTSSDDDREDDMRDVVHYVSPDIIMAEEVHNSTGYTHFLTDVLNYDTPSLYAGADFTDQYSTDIDIALFFKPAYFEFISTSTVDVTNQWGHRDVIEFVMKHMATNMEFRLYGVHLKAGDDPADIDDRESEANNLRNYLNELDPSIPFLVLGDFNFYHSGEGGFQRLTESQVDNDGRVFDPINRIGYWHINYSFRDVHTQSPRYYGNGGAGGGMDDRFDFILASSQITNTNNLNYVGDSYTPFGNDGQHFNQAINYGINSAVPDTIADALVVSSDHIPVYLELSFITDIATPNIVINEIMQNPAAVSDSYGEWFEIFNADSIVVNLCGWTIRDLGTDNHVIQCDSESLYVHPGDYFVLGQNGDTTLNGGVELDYDYSSITLGNSGDEIILLNENSIEVDRVEYDGGPNFPDPNGASMALLDPAMDNSVGSNWSTSTEPYGNGDLGTPGAQNFGITINEEPSTPQRILIFQNYPNPFNPVTTIRYELPEQSYVTIVIYDLMGRVVKELVRGRVVSGYHKAVWDGMDSFGKSVGAGVYLYQIRAEGFTQTRKMLLLK